MSKRKLQLVRTLHKESAPQEGSGKDSVMLVFNRPIHRLEAMGIAQLIAEDLANGS